MKGLYKTPHVHVSHLLQVLPGPAQSKAGRGKLQSEMSPLAGDVDAAKQKELSGGRHGVKQNSSSPGEREAGYYS